MTIAKISGRKKSQGGDYAGSGFKGLAMYMLNPKADNPSERVGMAYALNFGEHTEHMRLEDAAGLMRNTVEQHRNSGHRLPKPVWHFQINFHPSDTDKLTPELMQEYVREHMAAIGLQEHQMLVVEHVDTDHRHLHIMVNRVHPVTGKAARDRILNPTLSETAQRLDAAHGLYNKFNRLHEHPHDRTGYSRAADEIAQRQKEARPIKDPKKVQALRDLVGDDFRGATSWQELSEALATKGVHLEGHQYRGREHIRVVQGEEYVNLSKIGKDIRQEGLEQRLGRFDEYQQTLAGQQADKAPEQAAEAARATLTPERRLEALQAAIAQRQAYSLQELEHKRTQGSIEDAERERTDLLASAVEIAAAAEKAERDTLADVSHLFKPEEAAAYFATFKRALSAYRDTANAPRPNFAEQDAAALAHFRGRLQARKRARLQKVLKSRDAWLAAVEKQKAHAEASRWNKQRRAQLYAAEQEQGLKLNPKRRAKVQRSQEAAGLLVRFSDIERSNLPAGEKEIARRAIVQDNYTRRTATNRIGADWTTAPNLDTAERLEAARMDYAAYLEAGLLTSDEVSFEEYKELARETAQANRQQLAQSRERGRGRSLGR